LICETAIEIKNCRFHASGLVARVVNDGDFKKGGVTIGNKRDEKKGLGSGAVFADSRFGCNGMQ